MKLAKSLLLGSAAALVATAGATAADLPSKKAAPVQYVKICDAYGSGFFNIPGSDTCVKIGGRVRADYSLSGKAASYANNVPAVWANGAAVNWTGAPGVADGQASTAATEYGAVQSWNGASYGANPSGSASTVVPNGYAKDAANMQGWEARARIDMDARTPTSYGTVQTVMSLRLARTTGVLAAGSGATASGASPTLEAAYIRFAGFTFGASRDNFSFMPSTFYGAGHWSSFANGAKQLAYTAVLGGGFSATLAMQDAADTTAGGVNARARVNQTTGAPVFFSSNSDFTWDEQARGLNSYASNTLPRINLRLDLDQSWGGVSLMGAVAQAVAVNPSASFNKNETVWAAGAGLKLNLPMIAAGDVLWLNAAYADGMTEYTTNWTSFKSSDTRSNVGGYQTNHPSWISGTSSTGVQVLETFKSWNAAAIFTHFWTPQWRHSFMGSYGAIEAPQFAKAQPFGYSGAFGDAKVWNVGTQLTWLPTRNFEIGVDVLYARVSQDVTRLDYGANAITTGQNTTAPAAVRTTRENAGNWTGRLRVERTF